MQHRWGPKSESDLKGCPRLGRYGRATCWILNYTDDIDRMRRKSRYHQTWFLPLRSESSSMRACKAEYRCLKDRWSASNRPMSEASGNIEYIGLLLTTQLRTAYWKLYSTSLQRLACIILVTNTFVLHHHCLGGPWLIFREAPLLVNETSSRVWVAP